MRLLKLQKSGFVDFERLRKEPFGNNWRITFHLVHWGHIVIGVRPQCGQLKPRTLIFQYFWAYILHFFTKTS